MAEISQVKLPNNSTYDIRDKIGGNLYIVKGTQTAKTGAWTGTINVSALYDGLTIAYYLPYAGDGNATLNLTLADGTTTGAVNVYYSNANRMTTHYGAGSTIILTYWSAGSISVAGTATTDNRWTCCEYDSTNTYRLTDYYGYYKAYTVLYRYQICLTKNETSILPINTVSNSTATTKTLTTESFNPFGPIFYYSSTTTVSAGNNIGANTLGYQYLADLRYSFNTGSTLTAAKAVYLVATLGTGCSATLASNPISQTLPSTVDGLIYIYLGQAYDTYRIELSTKHPVYRYINNALRVLKADDVVTINGITPGAAMAKGVVTSIDTSANLPTSNAVKTFVEGKGYVTTGTESSNSTTGITIADHTTAAIYGVSSSTTTVTGVQSNTTTVRGVKTGTNSTTTASKVVLGNVITVPNISASDVTIPIRADSDTTVPIAASNATIIPVKNESATVIPIMAASATACDDITRWQAGSGDLVFTMDTTDTKKLIISHSHVVPNLEYIGHFVTGVDGTTSIYGVQSTTISVTGVSGNTTIRGVKTGTNSTLSASKVSFGSNINIPNVTSVTDVVVPIRADSDTTVPIKNTSATTVPIKNTNSTTVVTGKMHTITDTGHTHTI